nr:copia protein [Tanacetum cinerariifolium]
MDVKNAFFNDFINENVYVAQPMGFINLAKPNYVYRLKKALYGLKQAPKSWYVRLKAFLIKHDYSMGMVDNTLFTKEKDSNLIIVQIYVDDIIFGSTCQEMCDDFAKIMHDEFEMIGYHSFYSMKEEELYLPPPHMPSTLFDAVDLFVAADHGVWRWWSVGVVDELRLFVEGDQLESFVRNRSECMEKAYDPHYGNGDQPLPRVTQVSIAGTSSTEQPPLKDKSMCNKTAKDLWDALARHMLGSEYGEQDRKAVVLSVAIQKIINKNLMDIKIDALYNILKQNQGDVNDAIGSKKKIVVVTSDLLALIAEKTNVSRSIEKVVVSSDSKGSEADDFSELKKITALVKCYNCKKEGHFAKHCKKSKVKDYEYYKTKMLVAKKDKDEQVLLAEDQAWMESSSDSDQEINVNMFFMAQIKKVLSDSEASSSSADEKISEEKYTKLEAERYKYMIRYSTYFDNDKQHRKKIANQQVLYDKMSVQLVELEKHVRDLKNIVRSCKSFGKEKANLETIESLKSKGFKSSETVVSKSENQNQNDCHEIEKDCHKEENPKVIAPGMFKLSVSQSVSPVSMSKSSCESNNVEIKLKRKRHKRKSSKQNDKQVNNDVLHANTNFVQFLDLDTFRSVRRPKHSGVVWKKKWSSNTFNADLSSVSHLKVNKDVKRYSRKDLLMCDVLDDNNSFIFDDESVRISPVSKMPFTKKPCDSMIVCSKSNMYKSLSRTVHKWLPKLQLLAEPVAKWFPRICLWIIDSGCSKHMTGNLPLLTNFVEKFLGTVRFGNNDFMVIVGYGDVIIGSMTIKKVYYVKGLGHNLFSVGQFCDKGFEVAFRKSTCFVQNEDGVYLLTDDRSSNLYTIALNEVASN